MVLSRYLRSFFIVLILFVGCINVLSAEPFQSKLTTARALLERSVKDEKVQKEVLVRDIKNIIDLVITETGKNPEFKQYGAASPWSLKKRFFQPVLAVFVPVHARKLDTVTLQDFLSKANELVQAFSVDSSALALEDARWWQHELHTVAGVPLNFKGKKAGFFDVGPHIPLPETKNPDPLQKVLIDIASECDTLKKRCLLLLGQYQDHKTLKQEVQDKIDQYKDLLMYYDMALTQLTEELKKKMSSATSSAIAEKQKIQAKIDDITKKIDAVGKSIADILTEKV